MKRIRIILEMIKFEHTIFALPFAYMGALLGSMIESKALPGWMPIVWITLAMIGARSAAMGLNRVIDRTIDGKNPRTEMRAIPAGLLKSKDVIWFIVLSLVLMLAATSQLNTLCMELLPVAVAMLVLYSYTKRFTWGCHLFLGFTQALAALGGWVAITGSFSLTAVVLYVTVAFWTAGFDVIYACQDIEFDRKEGLYSIPGRFGIAKALWIARGLHVVTAVGLFSLFFLAHLSWWYLIGLMISYLILFYEHWIVRPHDLSRLNTAFFTMNGVLSVVVFVFTCVDLAVHHP
jgi:4-hydroxybenzoate polyprenyltransferase